MVAVLALVGLTKKRFGHHATLKILSLRSQSANDVRLEMLRQQSERQTWTEYYHPFSEPNVYYLAQLQMELCRTANMFSARPYFEVSLEICFGIESFADED